MATQNSQLIENLNLIYNEKLAQKTVLETTSDDFLMYHTYIAALKPVGYTSILQNGQVDVSSYKYAYVSVDGGGIVPAGSYTISTNGEYDIYNYATAVVEVDSSIPEGYVLPSGNIDLIQNGMVDVKEYAYATVAMPVPTGTVNLTENGTAIDVSEYASANVAVPIPSGYVLPSGILEINENVIAADCSSYQYVTVDVEGGGSGSSSDPWYSAIEVASMIYHEETTADYVMSTISDNWSYDYTDDGEGTISFNVSWDEILEIEENGDMVEKIVRVEIDGDPHEIVSVGTNINTAIEDDESIYGNIYPILENATLTASEDPSEDGYDYLLVGDLYAWNLYDNSSEAQEITENGFYVNDGALGFDVNVQANTGEIEITTNGKYYAENKHLDGWHYVKVAVPTSGITPSGTSYITTNGSHDVTSYATAYVNVPLSLSGIYTRVLASGLWEGWDLIDLQNITPRYLSLATLHDITYDGGTPEYYCLRLEDTNGNTVATTKHPGYRPQTQQTSGWVEGDVCVINLVNGNYTFKVYLQHYIFDNVDNFTLDSDTVLKPSTPYVDISITGFNSQNLELWNSGGSNLVWNVYYKGSDAVFHA